MLRKVSDNDNINVLIISCEIEEIIRIIQQLNADIFFVIFS